MNFLRKRAILLLDDAMFHLCNVLNCGSAITLHCQKEMPASMLHVARIIIYKVLVSFPCLHMLVFCGNF